MYLLLLVAVSSVLLTSLRTAEAFFRSAANSKLGEWAGWTEAALAILAIEGSMVVYSMIRAKNSTQSNHGQSQVYIFGIAVLAVISVVAALGQSVNLMSSIPQDINLLIQWSLTLVIGPGGALAALIGGHLLGMRLSQLATINSDGSDEWRAEYSDWNDGLVRSWNSNKKKYIGDFENNVTYHPEPVSPAPIGREWGYGELRGAIEDWFTINHISIDANVDYQQIADEIGHNSSESVRVTIAKMRKE